MKKKNVILLVLLLSPIFLFSQENLPNGTELLTNNYFDDGLNNWELFSVGDSRAEYELDTNSVITGKNSVHVTVNKPFGGYPSGRIQLNQHNIPGGIVQGNTYYVSFNLKVNKDIDQGFWTIYKEPDYQSFYNWDWVRAKKNKVEKFSYTFRANGTDEFVYFAIDLASLKNNNVELWIDDIHLIALPVPILEAPLPLGGIELLRNNYFNNGLNSWDLIRENSSDAAYYLEENNILIGKNSVHVKVNNTHNSGSQKTQLLQKNLPDSVEVGSMYHIQFVAKSNKAVSNLFWSINRQNNPKNNIYTKEFSLPANEAVTIADTIVAFASKEKVSWSFDLGTISEDSVDIWFDGVHFVKIVELGESAFPPETTWKNTKAVYMPKPGYLQSVREPKYGIDYTCISDPTVFGVSSGSNALLHHYAKDQVWNADMSKIILGNAYLVNANNYTFDIKLYGSFRDGRWSNTNPKIRYFCSGDKLKTIDIELGVEKTLHIFSGYSATIGPWEGNISADDKYIVVTDESGDIAVRASLYDIELDSVISSKNLSGDIDWVSVTPSGEYIVINNRGIRRIEVYDKNFNFLRYIGVGAEHGDFGVDSEGNEVWVQVIPLSMHRLKDGKSTRLVEPNIAGHISGRGLKNPGWAFVSTAINSGLNETEMFSVKLDGSGTIRHYGHARTSCTTYSNYPLGSVSPDGKKVVFNSDWDLYGSGGNALAYVAEFRLATDVKDNDGNLNKNMSFILSQNYPNPFNPTTTINYVLHASGMTKLSVYNILGQEVKVLLNEHMQAGSYSTPFNGSNLTSGVYFYKLTSNNQTQVKKMLLIK